MLKIIVFIMFDLFIVSISNAQVIKGRVIENNSSESTIALQGANIYWLGTTIATTSDSIGFFKISKDLVNNTLVVSYVGYYTDTLNVKSDEFITVKLNKNSELKEVVINNRSTGSYISKLKTIQTEVITEEGLEQLACCNLAESFENNLTVDVDYTDAVSGAKQIKMLGLAGTYSQLMIEGIPVIRGLSSTYGLNLIPGSWMKSIQVSKGASSVSNGYESISGQINIELKKPRDEEPLFINLYQNSEGRTEANLVSSQHISSKLSNMIMLNGSNFSTKIDMNKDGFLDAPLLKQVNLLERWWFGTSKMELQALFNYVGEKRDGGQLAFFNFPATNYGIGTEMNKITTFFKNGYRFTRPSTSIGIIGSYNYTGFNSFYGLKKYRAIQNSIYSSVIFQSYLINTNHKYLVGLNYQSDDMNEHYRDTILQRLEQIPGVFAQYTFDLKDKISFISGIRADFNSLYGNYVVPRFHLKYLVNKTLNLRASAGRGLRTPNLISENSATLASARLMFIDSKIKMEDAWNYGINATQDIYIKENKLFSLAADYYYTRFSNQLVVDLDKNQREIHFYNLDGKSYSRSYQFQVVYYPIDQLDITSAIKYNDVKSTINTVLIEVPFVNKYKALATLSFKTKNNKWQIDITNQLNGMSRLPITNQNSEFKISEYSPVYYILHAQLTKRMKNFDIYFGGENLTDYIQNNPIISANNPFGSYFDASLIWGPLTGRMIYGGIRLTIK